MKRITLVTILILFSLLANSQEKKLIYIPTLNGMKQIDEAVTKAKDDNKNVLVQVGGNWCPWCFKFNNFCKDVPQIDSIIKSSYVLIHLNYSKENRNYDALERLGFPQRFGFPVLVVLNSKGERLHTQDSGLLEKEKGYDTLKVATFLNNWTPQIFNKERYIVNENK
ncbi:MAG: hypothetical protein A2X08_08915 [Bacteroidetes bacterium GWA2_32_17]|nr:MAG: hypothetical protein A2X08_08915 [Bacteroidetes bacterium GWA2_32_17]